MAIANDVIREGSRGFNWRGDGATPQLKKRLARAFYVWHPVGGRNLSVRTKRSRDHHWWPVGLQGYWADRDGDLSWIEPDGKVEKKRFKNRKIALKAHGHTALRETVWEKNFEVEFDIDDQVHRVVSALQSLKPLGTTPAEFLTLIKLNFKRERSPRDMCKFYNLDVETHRTTLLLIYSILIRSPSNRFQYDRYPGLIGLPPDEDVGKLNMAQSYATAKKLCRDAPIANHFLTLLHSPRQKFIFGDGVLDWLTNSLGSEMINGKALLPITPHICVYFSTPRQMRGAQNCASFVAAPWMVDWVNDITQIYSRDRLFFLGRPPKLQDVFRQRVFLRHKERSDGLIDILDQISEMSI